MSRSVGRTYLFHPGTQERLWLLDEQPAGVIATWGWKLVDASAPEKGRVYVHLRTGAQQHAAPASHDAAPAGSNSAGSSASGAAVSSVGSKRSFVAASDGSSSGSAVPDAKKSRAADSADREPKGSGGASALPEKSDAPALRPPTDLDVSDIHFGAPHDSSPGLAPIIPAALISAVRDLSKSRRGIGLPAERPAHDPFYHGWFFPAHKVVLKELLNEDTKLIIELGCWLGKSLFFMAQCAPNAVLLTIDLWDNTFIVNVQGDHYCNNERQVSGAPMAMPCCCLQQAAGVSKLPPLRFSRHGCTSTFAHTVPSLISRPTVLRRHSRPARLPASALTLFLHCAHACRSTS